MTLFLFFTNTSIWFCDTLKKKMLCDVLRQKARIKMKIRKYYIKNHCKNSSEAIYHLKKDFFRFFSFKNKKSFARSVAVFPIIFLHVQYDDICFTLS